MVAILGANKKKVGFGNFLTVDLSKVHDLELAFRDLSEAQKEKVMPQLMNDIGKTLYGKIVKSIAHTTGAVQSRVRKVVRRNNATRANPIVRISAKDGAMTLKDFSPKQRSAGVSAKAWGRNKLYRRAFIGPNQHVFKRGGPYVRMTKGSYKGKKRQVITKLWGPIIPFEMVKEDTANEISRVIKEVFPRRVAYLVDKEIGRVKRRYKV